MIEYTDLLNTLAQIALGVLGFTGVVVALRQRTSEWTQLEKISFQALVTTTSTALVGAILPQVIAILVEDQLMVWKYANLGIGILHLSNFVAIMRRAAFADIGADKRGRKGIFDSLLGIGIIVGHFAAAFGILPYVEFMLIIGVIQQLYIGTGNFLWMITADE